MLLWEWRRFLCALWMQVKRGHDQYAFFLCCFSLFTSKNYVENLAPESQKHAICHFYLNECQVSLYVFGGGSRVGASITDSDLSVVPWNKKFLDAVSLNENTNSHETYPHEKKKQKNTPSHNNSLIPLNKSIKTVSLRWHLRKYTSKNTGKCILGWNPWYPNLLPVSRGSEK